MTFYLFRYMWTNRTQNLIKRLVDYTSIKNTSQEINCNQVRISDEFAQVNLYLPLIKHAIFNLNVFTQYFLPAAHCLHTNIKKTAFAIKQKKKSLMVVIFNKN